MASKVKSNVNFGHWDKVSMTEQTFNKLLLNDPAFLDSQKEIAQNSKKINDIKPIYPTTFKGCWYGSLAGFFNNGQIMCYPVSKVMINNNINPIYKIEINQVQNLGLWNLGKFLTPSLEFQKNSILKLKILIKMTSSIAEKNFVINISGGIIANNVINVKPSGSAYEQYAELYFQPNQNTDIAIQIGTPPSPTDNYSFIIPYVEWELITSPSLMKDLYEGGDNN